MIFTIFFYYNCFKGLLEPQSRYKLMKRFSYLWSSPGGPDGRESACIVGDQGSIPGSGRFPGEGNGYPLQYSCLENFLGRGAWWAAVHDVAQSRT